MKRRGRLTLRGWALMFIGAYLLGMYIDYVFIADWR